MTARCGSPLRRGMALVTAFWWLAAIMGVILLS
jgi:hypothetical protein